MSKLNEYNKRRDFRRTPEPSGKGRKGRGKGKPIFVVQEHEATHHHFDFRLEVDGVLKSWAVPKGVSTDPREKRLAVRTEDHPLDYADFEGVIPEDEYGAGTVIVWDTGTYRNIKEDDDGEIVPMEEALDSGAVEVWLEGKKLRGGYALVHAKLRGDERNWLLVKMDDEAADARRKPAKTEPESALSGRTLEEIESEESQGDEDDGGGR